MDQQQSSSSSPRKHKSVVGPVSTTPGRHSFTVNGHVFEVPRRYTVSKLVGMGAYGVVCAGHDAKTNARVAIKKCHSVFRDVGDCKRVLREVKLLLFFHHENLLGVRSFFLGGPVDRFTDVYVVTDLYDTDLNTVVRSRQNISEEHMKYFMYQLLRGLKFIHTAGVMHRDLKPANLLVNINCDLRICDFGLARGVDVDVDNKHFTDYVVTRWYRPPELLLMNTSYTTSVDVWSAGCIFAELAARKPVFMGRDYVTQLRLVCEAVGPPDESETTQFLQSQASIDFLKAMPPCPGRPLSYLAPTLDDCGLDFLSKMLQFNPAKRWTAAQLMAHPYLATLHDEADEPCSPSLFSWPHDLTDDLSIDDLRSLFAAEAVAFPDDALM